MKKMYMEPEVEITLLPVDDIVTTSPQEGEENFGGGGNG